VLKHIPIIVAGLLGLALAIAGCSSSIEAEIIAAPAPEAIPQAAAAPPTPTADAAKEPDLAEPQPAAAQVAEFTPPFPERIDVFEPPKQAQSTVRRNDEHGETVELKGFITVDTPRVVLSIDGVVCAIPEGGEKYGVLVRSIQPPTVHLQRGRDRWPATLE
jgi:hypothetical protein